MPKTPNDIAACRDFDRRRRKATRDTIKAANKLTDLDAKAIREIANEMRKKQGLPPLGADELVTVIMCTRGRR